MLLRYWIIIWGLGLAWGSSFYFNAILLREIGPLSVSMGRVGVGALGCWLWVLVSGRSMRVQLPVLASLFVFGLFQYALPLAIYPFAQQAITSSAAGIINAMTPIMVVIVSHFWPGGERATAQKTVGVAVGFAGIVLLMLPSARGIGDWALWALCLAMLAPLCYGIGLNYIRRFAGMDRAVMTAWSLILATLFIAPLALWREGVPVITQTETWIALAVIGFVLTSMAFLVMFWLLPRVGGTTASTLTFIAPLSAVLLGVLLLNEHLTVYHLIGMLAIFAGLLLIDGRLWRRVRRRTPKA
ncbi:DMT family transporter [Pseudoruegeria sp. SK021]|uniref:DMT family transporter n=1 Tax=Pseudoruegeria sp. SK021 TaxID=1933035 RepID=UPI000A224122|nr:DMT family transporter [Pseudoruegeria sp. SK021]OSP56587.1 EamA family transporter [Pseudoruegeria sp. SK021]